jgi:hypothetical protein
MTAKFLEPFAVGRTHWVIDEILKKAGDGAPATTGGVFEILPGMDPSTSFMLMVHSIDGVTPFELETWTRGPIVTSLSEVEDTIFVIHQSAAGNAEMPYEPRLMPIDQRPQIGLFHLTQPGGEGLRFVLTYALVEAKDRTIRGLRSFSWSPHMSRAFARLYAERSAQEMMDRAVYLQKMNNVASRMTIKDVLDKKLAYSRSDRSNFIPFVRFM